MLVKDFVTQDGYRCTFIQDSHKVWYVFQIMGVEVTPIPDTKHAISTWIGTRRKEITGSKDPLIAGARFVDYAEKHSWMPYPEVICDDCAKSTGRTMPQGHCATFYDAECSVCGKLKQCTEPRDYGHFSIGQELKSLYRIFKERSQG